MGEVVSMREEEPRAEQVNGPVESSGERVAYSPEGYYGRARQVEAERDSMEVVHEFPDLDVTIHLADPALAQERLSRLESKGPVIKAFRAVGKAFHALEKELGHSVCWTFFGSGPYEMTTGSSVVVPDDADGMFDVQYADQLFTKFQHLTTDPDSHLISVTKEVAYTGSVVLRGILRVPGPDGTIVEKDFEMFGQNVGQPENKNGLVDVGAGDRHYDIIRMEGTDGEPGLNILGLEGQVELYAKRLFVEFQQGIMNLDTIAKNKVAQRLFRMTRLCGELTSQVFQDVLDRVLADLQARQGMVTRRQLVIHRQLHQMYSEFLHQIDDEQVTEMNDQRWDMLERQMEDLAQMTSKEVKSLQDRWQSLQAALSTMQMTDEPSKEVVQQVLALNRKLDFYALKYGPVEMDIGAQGVQIEAPYSIRGQLRDPAEFASYAIVTQTYTNFITPLQKDLQRLANRLGVELPDTTSEAQQEMEDAGGRVIPMYGGGTPPASPGGGQAGNPTSYAA